MGGIRGHNVMSHFVLLLILNPTANFLIDFCANKNNFTKHIIAAQTKLILSFMKNTVCVVVRKIIRKRLIFLNIKIYIY